MPVELDALRTLGLTEWEARAYQALVGLGSTTAPEVAVAADLPRTRVYALLGTLVVKGWAEAEKTRPKRFRAVSPTLSLERGRSQLLEQLGEAQKKLEALYSQDGVRWAGPTWLLAGEDAVYRRVKAMVRSSRSDVLMTLPAPIPHDGELLDDVANALERGVRVRIVVPNDFALPKASPVRGKAEIRLAPFPMRSLFVDGRQAFTTFVRPRPQGGVDYTGLWNPNRDLVEIFVSVLEGAWTHAKPLNQAAGAKRGSRP